MSSIRIQSQSKAGHDSKIFLSEVLRGLHSVPKELPCKYFYENAGSQLFERITELNEYYLTRTELAIMRRHAKSMAKRLGRRCLLIEYGTGNGAKTQFLLDELMEPAGYVPVDLAEDELKN